MRGVVRLDVFVEPGCRSCDRAVGLARDVDEEYPDVAVAIVDCGQSDERPADVFAVPTFMLNGHVVSLGNPKPADLRRAIEGLLETEVD